MALTTPKTKFEGSTPILCVANMKTSLNYYIESLGFQKEDWGSDDFTCVKRDQAAIYLCQGGQGQAGTWIWVGVENVEELYKEYNTSGAQVLHGPRNYPWALEMHVKDPNGHLIRFGSEPVTDRPFETWMD